MIRLIRFAVLLFCFSIFISHNASSQTKKGSIQRIKVHGKLLEGNLSGDPADRYVSIYLPASYKTNPSKHYPVVYFLHGYTDDDAKFFGLKKHWMVLPPILDTVFASGAAKEMIVVMPDAYTRFLGSMYSSSVTTGNWQDFVAKELVNYVDSHYRTIAKKESRGLCGHSMGGYGALRIGEKYPDVFSSVYLLSPCCLNTAPNAIEMGAKSFLRADSIKTYDQFLQTDFATKIVFACAAAWSPDPANPPFYLDLPVKDGNMQASVLQKWDANRPLNRIDQYIFNIKKLTAIGFDAGDRDAAIAQSLRVLDNELNRYQIKHAFEIYQGDHINRIADRIEKTMLEFFSANLSSNSGKNNSKRQ